MVSKLAMITKITVDKVKRRLILDCRVSGVNSKTVQYERIILPLVTDVVFDTLEMLKCSGGAVAPRFLVLDFSDAFFSVPLARAEQKYFCFLFEGRWYVMLRATQGSKNGPQAFGRGSAMLGRCLFVTGRSG